LFKKFRLHREENGNILVMFAFYFLIFIGISGLVIDVGILYKTKSELRKTANTSVLSGGQELLNSGSAVLLGPQELLNSESLVAPIVQEILKADGEEGSLKRIVIKPNGENKLKVTLEKRVPLHFMKLFGMNEFTVEASASGILVPMVAGLRAVPLGIDSSIDLKNDGTEYQLKVGAGDSTIGNFGVLQLSGKGSTDYQSDLKYGFNEVIKAANADGTGGDVLPTKTGNMDGNTRDAINYRISSSPYPEGPPYYSDDPRIILIMKYEPIYGAGKQLTSVRVVGFAFFYILKPMSQHDTTITGKFIESVGGGVGDENAADTGAYVVKLVEDIE
jgi:hypothetical protein